MEVSGKFHATAALPLETTHQIGDYSGPRAVLDVLEKSCVCIYIYIYIYIERERERERERGGEFWFGIYKPHTADLHKVHSASYTMLTIKDC